MIQYILIVGFFALQFIALLVLERHLRLRHKRFLEENRLYRLKYGLESQVWQLKSDKTVLESRIAGLGEEQTEMARLATRVGWLELDKARLEDRMAGLGEEKTGTEDQISWLENQIKWLEFDNAVLESRVTILTIKSAA